MNRNDAIAVARRHFDGGGFRADLSRRVAVRSESQNPASGAEMQRYLAGEMQPVFTAMGFRCEFLTSTAARAPFLYAERMEDPEAMTVLSYGHGDVVNGMDEAWRDGRSPWDLSEADGCWWGRGVADNKGQHSINLAALGTVLEVRGRLGFNIKFLMEMGEEVGSPGLGDLCAEHRDAFRADLFVASDGPRTNAQTPTVFLGSRGVMSIDLGIKSRDGGRHSGNFGGALSNPGVELAHAIAAVCDAKGRIRVPEWLPPSMPDDVRAALSWIDTPPDVAAEADPDWGEPGLSTVEKIMGWNSFEVLAFRCGNPDAPANAVPDSAWARIQLRFVAGTDVDGLMPALRRHLDAAGYAHVAVTPVDGALMHASRLDLGNPWVAFAQASLRATTGKDAAVIPNIGGSLPNTAFSEVLGLPTVWIPHSYPGCCQHAPNEHLPVAVMREGLDIMTGLFWDLGDASKDAPGPA